MTPLVLLPGMMCDARLFQHQITAFSGAYSLISVPLTSHQTITGMAKEVLSATPEKFAVAGVSMGGIVAMEVARLAPERVLGMALMDTNHLPETEEVKQRRGPQIEAVRLGNMRRIMREEMKPNYLTDGPNQGAILDLCMEMASYLGEVVFVNQSIALMNRADQTETLRSFKAPTLVLCGEDDTLCPVTRHIQMHEMLSDSTFKIIEHAGHLPTLEQPERTSAALGRWLERL